MIIKQKIIINFKILQNKTKYSYLICKWPRGETGFQVKDKPLILSGHSTFPFATEPSKLF